MGKLCPTKRRYTNLYQALGVLIAAQQVTPPPIARVYKCPVCNAWHTTAQPRRWYHTHNEQRAARAVLVRHG